MGKHVLEASQQGDFEDERKEPTVAPNPNKSYNHIINRFNIQKLWYKNILLSWAQKLQQSLASFKNYSSGLPKRST